MRARHPDAYALLLIVAAVLAVNATALTGWLDPDPMLVLSGLAHAGKAGLLPGGPGWTDPNIGTTTQALGHLSALNLLGGAMPWWNPYSGVGLPLAAAMQPSSLFLPFVLLLAFQKGVLWLKISMQIVAGAATYGLLRQLNLARLAALAGGLIFAMNGTFGWHGAYAPALPPAFLPLILLGVELATARARARRPGGVLALAAGLAWSLYAGFPETAYVDGLLAGAWSLLRVLEPDSAGRRLAVLGRIAAGGVLGLLLAAPILLAFGEYMHSSTMGLRTIGFGAFAYPPRFTALPFFPHVFGLPSGLWVEDRAHALANVFDLNGGWLGLAVAFLATLAALTPGRRRGLRWLLAGWIVVSFLKTLAVPGMTALVNLIPGAALIPWFRYGPPAWEMAAAVLAAMAIDDWRRATAPAPWRAVLAGVLVLAAAGAALAAGGPVFRSLLQSIPQYGWYLGASVAGGLAALAAVAFVWRRRPHGRWPAAMLAAATLEAAVLFATPMLAGRRDIRLDVDTVAFLQRNLGLQRFVSWDSIQANYGAYWRIAGLNYEYIPIPPNWFDHVQASLYPGPAMFIFAWRGQQPTGPDGNPLSPEALRALVATYEADAVKYVVVRAGLAGFEAPVGTASTGPPNAFMLPPDSWLSGSVAGADLRDGTLRGVRVLLGTYGGVSTGRLELELCAGEICSRGSADLSDAPDNASLPVALDPALAMRAGEAVRWRIGHHGGSTGVAVWLAPDPPGTGPGLASPWGPQPGRPVFAFDYGPVAGAPRLVFTGRSAEVWELPGPKPYFEVSGGPCRLERVGRESLDTRCDAPAELLRRELFYPGWTVQVNGMDAPVAGDGIFQRVELPGGPAQVRFAYAPPFIGFAYGLFVLGVAGLLQGPVRRWPQTRASLRRGVDLAVAVALHGGAAAAQAVLTVGTAAPGAVRAGLSARTALLAGFALLVALRMPSIWPYGRLWAEEGTFYLAYAWKEPLTDGLFAVHTGYMNLPASVATTLAVHLVALQHVPLFTVLVALALQLCPAVLLAVSGIRWLDDWRVLALALLVMAVPPFAEEVWLNTITSQFHIMLALAIILAAPPGRGVVQGLQGTVLMLAPLCGPGGGMLLPLYLLRAWSDRSRARLMQALLLFPGALVQVLTVLSHPEPARMIGLNLRLVLPAITARQVILPLTGPFGLRRFTLGWEAAFAAGVLPWWPAIVAVAAFGALAVLVWKCRDAPTRWLFAAAMVLMLGSYAAALTPEGPAQLLVIGFGNRYYFAPAVLVGLVLLGVALTGAPAGRVAGRVLVAWLLVIGVAWYPRAGAFYAHGPRWPDEVARWQADPTYAIGIWPADWGVTLARRP